MAKVTICTCYEGHHVTINASSASDANTELNHAKDAIDSRLSSEKQKEEKSNG